jgi:hypothetical protein
LTSVEVPSVGLSFTITVAPITGVSFSSTTLPLTVLVWADAAAMKKTAISDRRIFRLIGNNY